MHAQNEHSPPTSRSSTIATLCPLSASRPAATSPAGPAPTTTTSKLRIHAPVSPEHTTCRPLQWRRYIGPWGRHGFDVAGSRGRLRAEVPEASLNPGNTISANAHDSAHYAPLAA